MSGYRRKRRKPQNNIIGITSALIVILGGIVGGYAYDTIFDNADGTNYDSLNENEQDWDSVRDVSSHTGSDDENSDLDELLKNAQSQYSLGDIPEYTNTPFVIIDDNIPDFSESDKTRTDTFEIYSELDHLGRCGVAYANICQELMPTEERQEIGQIKPSGWHTVKYNDVIDGNYLYNRCHLIGFQLAGENANEKNLITGTRYLNVEGMLPFENLVSDYVKETDTHVLYRVTPIFEGENLVASGVQMEAWSVEDGGEGICFNVYCYNVQPEIEIDYATGDSHST